MVLHAWLDDEGKAVINRRTPNASRWSLLLNSCLLWFSTG